MKPKITLSQTYIKIFLFIFYVSIVIIMLFHHEQWRDEAQAWLIARDLSPFEIIAQMKYEGHPFLWHYILMPFAKMGFPYITANIISAIFCIISAAVLLKEAPFHNTIKLLILCSTPFLYYSFVARNYCLAVLLIVLLSTFYKNRSKKPIFYGILIGLLANTHGVMLGLAIMLVITEYLYELIFSREKYTEKQLKSHLIGLIIAIIGICIMLFIACLGNINNTDTLQLNLSLTDMFILIFINIKHFFNCLAPNIILTISVWVAIIIFLILLTIEKNMKVFFIFLGSIGYTIIISSFKYTLADHSVYAILLLGLFALWISYEKKNFNKYDNVPYIFISVIIFGANLFVSYHLVMSDFLYNYSASKDIANFINTNISENAIFICTDDCGATSIIPYLTKTMKFIYPTTNNNFTFVTRNIERKKEINLKTLENSIKNNSVLQNNVYVIHVIGILDEEIATLKERGILNELYTNNTALIAAENYSIFKVAQHPSNSLEY